MKSDLIRMGIVYPHLLACCVAIGSVFMSDVKMVSNLVRGVDDAEAPEHLWSLHRTLAYALGALWVTGAALVSFDVWMKGTNVLMNPKLQAKIAVVVLLTANGVILHRSVLPALCRAGSLMRMIPRQRLFAVLVGAMSAACWLYAALLGVGRPLNWQFSLPKILSGLPLLVGAGFIGMSLLTMVAGQMRGARQSQRDMVRHG
jgi:hypothetical protein